MKSRRDFLQKITASAFAIPFLPGNYVENMDRPDGVPYQGKVLRVAIMGLGSYGTRVAEAMQACKAAKLMGVKRNAFQN